MTEKLPNDRALQLIPAKNGGWTVEDNGKVLGAYSTPADMLRALADAFESHVFRPNDDVVEQTFRKMIMTTARQRREKDDLNTDVRTD
jgi:hypothetical protein